MSRSTPDDERTGAGLDQQLGQKGHLVVVSFSSIKIRIQSRQGWSKPTPDNDRTGAGLGQQLGKKGHLVVRFSSITFHHRAIPEQFTIWAIPGPAGDHRDCSGALSVHVYSVLIRRTGSQILKPVLLLEGPLIPST